MKIVNVSIERLFWLTKYTIRDNFEILLHWMIIVDSTYTFKDQNNYHPYI